MRGIPKPQRCTFIFCLWSCAVKSSLSSSTQGGCTHTGRQDHLAWLGHALERQEGSVSWLLPREGGGDTYPTAILQASSTQLFPRNHMTSKKLSHQKKKVSQILFFLGNSEFYFIKRQKNVKICSQFLISSAEVMDWIGWPLSASPTNMIASSSEQLFFPIN